MLSKLLGPSTPSQTASGRHRGLLVDDLVPVGLNLALWDILKSFFPGYGVGLGEDLGDVDGGGDSR